MTSNRFSGCRGQLVWGRGLLSAGLIAVAGVAIWFAGDIGRTGAGGGSDPGPRFFPLLLSLMLLVFGLIYAVQTILTAFSRTSSGDGSEPVQSGKADETLSPELGWRWLVLLVFLMLYIFAIGWIGFSVSTWLMASGMMIALGNRWWVAAGVALLMVVVIRLLFVVLFRVQLPAGELGLPF